MIDFFAGIFGYVLNFIYEIFKNYGLAIILFSILVKLIMIPLSISQQKSMKKSVKIQEKTREIQEKYKNDQAKVNQEVMELYKKENMSPFSGCLTAILQIVLLFSIFYLVRSPLTHMIKLDPQVIENYVTEVKEESAEKGDKISYPEIAVIKSAREKLKDEELDKEKKAEYEKIAINMDFLGLDLTNVPTQDMSNPTVFVIPVLYVISSFISIRISNNMNKKKTEGKEEEKADADPMANASKSMMWFMPIMSISIAIIAPLGLALYWLVSNILMIVERLIMDKLIKDEEEVERNA